MSTKALAGYAKYDGYKDSGINELGQIPEKWELLSNKHIFSIKNIRVGKKSEDYDLLSLTLKGIVKRDMENPQGKFPAEFDTYQEVKTGDFVFCLFDVEETPRTVGLSEFDGMITGAYTVLEVSPSFDKVFIYYFYLNLDNEKMLKPLYRGLRNTIPKDWFMTYKTFIPTYEEQKAIADFLDQKTTQIDQAIALKQQQIEKLNEYKQITTQNAVTKGLDANAKMKDSGIDWLGDIPAHWEVKKLKYIFESIQTGTTPATSNESFFGGNINWYSPRDLNKEKLEESERKVSKLAIDHKEAKLFPKDSVLVVGIGATSGKTAYMSVESAFNQQITGLHSEKQINIFYFYLLKSMSTLMLNLAEYTTLPILNNEFFKSLFLVVPPLKEQKEIVEYIEGFDKSISQSVTILKQQIENLKEYKTILINHAVTGKIKVS